MRAAEGGGLLENTVDGVPAGTESPRAITPAARPLRSASPLWSRLGLAAVVLLAGGLRVWRLDQNGYGTEYYAAGVRSMLTSWHNFFYNSFDPAGFVSVDKPPVALWVQVASARVFGFSGLSVLLPQVLEGVAAVVLLFHLVRRQFGVGAGLLAALILAMTPVSVAIDRSSNTDSCLVLVLLLAAWALIRAAERGSWRLLLVSMALVGVGFNVKMLAAFVVLPTFVLVYWLGATGGWRRRLGHLTMAAAVLTVVSLSWITAFDLTPPERRPFAGSSTDNSMLNLAVGHNGIERFVRRTPRFAGPGGPGARPGLGPPAGGTTGPPGPPSTQPTAGPRDASSPGAAAARRRAFWETTPVGPLRLASPRLAGQVGWLMPLAVLGLVVSAGQAHPSWPLAPRHLALLLWGGWALTYGIVYSYAGGIFQPYYLATMAPPLAALAAIGVTALFAWHRQGGRRRVLLPVALLLTAAWQASIEFGDLRLTPGGVQPSPGAVLGAAAGPPGDWRSWLHLALLLGTALAVVGLLVSEHRAAPGPPPGVLTSAALGAGVLALLLIPAAWALSSPLARGNVMRPLASLSSLTRPDDSAALRPRGRFGRLANLQPLVAFLKANRQGERYLLATASTQQAAPIVIQTGEAVMAMGGFMGWDPILTPDGLARMVEEKQVRFVMLGSFGVFGRRAVDQARQKALTDWIREKGRPVDPVLWRSTPAEGARGDAPGQREPRPGESDTGSRVTPGGPSPTQGSSSPGSTGGVDSLELYDLRPAAGIVPALSN